MQPASCSIIALSFAEYMLAMVPGLSGLQEDIQVAVVDNNTYNTAPGFLEPVWQDYLHWTKKMMAVSAIFFISFVNVWSVKLASWLQNVFTVAKLGAIFVIVIAGAVRAAQGNTENVMLGFQQVPGTDVSIGSVALAFYSG